MHLFSTALAVHKIAEINISLVEDKRTCVTLPQNTEYIESQFMIYLIATLTLKPGSVEAVKEIALPCIEATRREPGCISYDLNQSLTDENTLVFIERWKDQAALDSHFKEPHLSTWREAAAPYFTDRAIEIIEPQVVKTL